MNHVGTNRLLTKRLILDKITIGYETDLFELFTDQSIKRYFYEIPMYNEINQVRDYITNYLDKKYKKNNFYDWGIYISNPPVQHGGGRTCQNRKLIGRIGVFKSDKTKKMIDLYWYLNKDFRGNGYMVEALKSVVDVLFRVGFKRIEAFADVQNINCNNIMHKVGFEYEGLLRKYDLNCKGELYDVKMYSIISE